MISINLLYEGPESLRCALEKWNLPSTALCLVKIFTACMNRGEAVDTAKQVRKLLPNAQIVGATAAGIIFKGKQYENETMILVEQYDSLKISTQTFLWKGKTAEQLAGEVCAAFQAPNNELIHILFSDRYYDVNAFVEEMNRLAPRIRLAGGIAGDLLDADEPGFVFTDEGAVDDSAVAFSVTGENAVCFIDVNTAQEPISPVFTVTGTKDSLIRTIENEPADAWLYHYLALDERRAYNGWKSIADHDVLIRFQMILEGHGTAGRFLRYDEQEQCISLYFSRIAPGTRFRMGYTNPSKCVRDCYELCQKIMDQPVEQLFVYTCLFRKLYMQNSSEWELRPFRSYNVCGIFMMGEIGFINGQNEFYNGSCLVTGIAESRRFIMPDISVLADFTQIDDDLDKMEFAIEKQKETLSVERRDFLKGIENQRRIAQLHMYHDARLGLPNVLMYQADKRSRYFDKMCMVQVENDDILISYAGLDAYLKNTQEIIEEIQKFLSKHSYEKEISLYCVTQSIFFFTADKNLAQQRFEHIMHKLYKNFQYFKPKKSGLAQMARFVMVSEQEDMLQGGLNALQATKDIQSHFIVCRDNSGSLACVARELEIIELLNTAITKDGILPFYQGIRNNHTGHIDRYEALMRLTGPDGNIYCPDAFMDIAKKYHLYSMLSRAMIEKVLNEFENRDEPVSINLLMLDVDSAEFREWFFERVKQFGNPNRLVIELVESEDYVNSADMAIFVERLHEIGCKVAIDDFGTGYSSLAEVIALKPDYIKVDGSIIEHLDSASPNMVLLKTIIFLAKQLDIQIVAEYVEDTRIQGLLEENEVDFSQGFLFSKPMPFKF